MLITTKIVGLDDIIAKLERLKPPSEKVTQALKSWTLYYLEPEIQKNLAGKVLHRRTGHLASRVQLPVVSLAKGGSKVSIQTRDVPYAFIHEYGGTIRPVRAKALTIPLPAAMTRAGVVRKSAREWDNTWLSVKNGKDAVICHTTASGKVEPLFVLKRKVVIKASAWASKAVNATVKHLDKELTNIIGEDIK